MLRRELAGRRKRMAFLVVACSAGGGGRVLLLLGLSGGFWQVAGCSVMVSRALNWTEEGYRREFAGWVVLDRNLVQVFVVDCWGCGGWTD